MILYFIRHGETVENREHVIQGQKGGKLTEKGIEQAKRTGELIKNVRFDIFFVSDLARARDTAKEIIAHHPDARVVYEKRLRERSAGIFEGEKPEKYFEYIEKYQTSNPDKTFFTTPIPKGESLVQAQKRIVAFFNHIRKTCDNKTVCFVGHGAVLRLLIMHLKKIPEEQYYDDLIRLGNGSITVLNFEKGGDVTAEKFNYTKHLEG